MFYQRAIAQALTRYAKFPVLAILGPRQSGKTTLAKYSFGNYKFLNLEEPQLRAFAKEDPKRFLQENENSYGIVIDEFQYVPELLSYIQLEVDVKDRPGYFVLTGSQNFLMNQAITQSLAGRVGIVTLLPLALQEMINNSLIGNVEKMIFNGGYPRLYQKSLAAADFYPAYLHTYIERDVRQLTNVGDILIFQKFMRACAARCGQLLNVTELAMTVGVDQRLVKKWLSVLESSYIIFILKPYFNNLNKRLTKTPKLYFYDTGLVCALLDIQTEQSLSLSPQRGPLFETLIISDFYKQYHNLGRRPALYFWRDQNGRVEIDCFIDRGDKQIPVEIKSSTTISKLFFTSLLKWNELLQTKSELNNVVYAGVENQNRGMGKIIGWQAAADFIQKLYENN